VCVCVSVCVCVYDIQADWDGCLKEYNKSLTSFNIEASKLDDLEQQLAQLVQNCSDTSPPPPGKYFFSFPIVFFIFSFFSFFC